MSLELDNINEPNEETKEQELEQFGVWIKNPPHDNLHDDSANSSSSEKSDVSSGFDDTFEIPSAVSSADGFESASFSDLSDFDIDDNSFLGDSSSKDDDNWDFNPSEFDIPDPPEFSEAENKQIDEQLSLESELKEENMVNDNIPADFQAEESLPDNTDTITETPNDAETTDAQESFETPDNSETSKESSIENSFNEENDFNDFLPSAATNDLDISDLSDFDFGDDSSFPVPDSITGQSYINEEAENSATKETETTAEASEPELQDTESEQEPLITESGLDVFSIPEDFSAVSNDSSAESEQEPTESAETPEDIFVDDSLNTSTTFYIEENNAEPQLSEPDFAPDIAEQAAEEPSPAESAPAAKQETPAKPLLDISGYDDVSITDISSDTAGLGDINDNYGASEEAAVSEESFAQESPDDSMLGEEMFGDIEFEDITAAIPEEEKVVPKAEEIDEVAEAIFSNVEEEIDIDSFLNDSPAPSMGGTEEISLEDFMSDSDFSDASEFKDFISSTTTEKSDILNDPPIDMSLSFDDSFVLETKANPEDDIETDIPVTQDFISDIVTTGEETFDNFDDIFDNITDMNAPAEPEIKQEEIKPESNVEFDEVSEFDDLLNSFQEPTGTTDETVVVPASKTTKKVDFDIQVNLDESEIKHETIETPDDSEEEVAVELFTDKGSADDNTGNASGNTTGSSFSIADIDDSISFVDETLDAPASSIIDDLSFAGVEIVDISDKPAESNSAETKQEQQEISQEANESMSSVEFEGMSNDFDFPEIDDALFEKAMAAGTEPEESKKVLDSNVDIPENNIDDKIEIPEDKTEIPEDEPGAEISFDELPDADDIFDTAEHEESLGEAEIAEDSADAGIAAAASALGAGIVAAASIAEEEPAVEEPAAEETPAIDDFALPEEPIMDETPVVEETPAVDDFSQFEETATEEIPVENEIPSEDNLDTQNDIPIEEMTLDIPAEFEISDTDDTTVSSEESVTEEKPVQDNFAISEEQPVVEETPVVEDFAMPEEPVVEETPIAEETPISDGTPAVEEQPVVEDTPVIEDSVFDDTDEEEFPAHTDEIDIPIEETPLAEDTPVIGETPVIDEVSDTEEESVIEEPSLSEEQSVIEDAPVSDDTPDYSTIGIGVMGAAAAATVASGILNDEETEQEDSFISEETVETDQLNAENELDVVENCIYNDNQGDMEVVSDMNEFDINTNESMDNSAENPVLDKIVNELSALRNEMASIKAELDILKKGESADSATDDIKLPETDTNESTGFFSGDEDDETIALSGDELNNILNSADFTEETAEQVTQDDIVEPAPEADEIKIESTEAPAEDAEDEIVPEETLPDTEAPSDDTLVYDEGEGPDTSIDFDENVTEPVIDDINFDIDNEENAVPDELPEETTIPSSEDSFIVDSDSSTSDFLDDNEPTLDEALSSDKVSYLNEDSSDNVTFEDNTEEPAQSGFVPITQDELTATFENASSSEEPEAEESEEIDDTPAESVFESEQWEPEPESAETADFATEASETDVAEEPVATAETPEETAEPAESNVASMPDSLKNDVKSVLAYMDQLLENLPEEKIAEFARSEHFEVYKKLFTELGLA